MDGEWKDTLGVGGNVENGSIVLIILNEGLCRYETCCLNSDIK